MAFDNMNKRVLVQRRTVVTTSIGEVTETWTTIATVWARIEPLSGKEAYWSQQVTAEATTKIHIRHIEGLTAYDRIIYGTRAYSIVAPPLNIDERGAYDELLCVEAA